jgi:hypothetical protein
MGPSAKAEQKERRALAGSTTTMTKAAEPQSYFSRARAGLDDDSPGGRYRPDQIISGSSPAVNYPAASGPWADPVRVPDEPLIDATDCGVTVVEAVGTYAEVEASLSNAAPAASSAGSQSGERLTAPSLAERMGAVPSFTPSSGGTAPTSLERLAESLPRLAVAVPKPKRRKVRC